LAASDWTPKEVITCWLAEQQGGVDDWAKAFGKHAIDEATLTDLPRFEDLVTTTLGTAIAAATGSKIKVKKLVMAAKRLAATRADLVVGREFDANQAFDIVWGGKPKLIAGMRHALEYLVASNHTEIVAQCRSDYAYGPVG
jgi:hypothetical protein